MDRHLEGASSRLLGKHVTRHGMGMPRVFGGCTMTVKATTELEQFPHYQSL